FLALLNLLEPLARFGQALLGFLSSCFEGLALVFPLFLLLGLGLSFGHISSQLAHLLLQLPQTSEPIKRFPRSAHGRNQLFQAVGLILKSLMGVVKPKHFRDKTRETFTQPSTL